MKIIPSSWRRHHVATISIFLVTVALIAGMAGCDGNGSDPYADYIKIYNWTDLDNIRNNLVAKYILMNDLDSSTAGYSELVGPTANGGEGWQPIGTEDDWFTGSFDGQGYEIRELFIDRPSEVLVGLFGYVDEEGIIANIGVVNATVTGNMGVGSLVGDTVGNVTNCYATGNVTGDHWVGGLVGANGGDVGNSHFTGSVTGNGTGEVWGSTVGGLVGFNGGGTGTVNNSYSTGSVTGYGDCAGGLVGGSAGATVAESYSTSSVTGYGQGVGGLVGVNGGTTVSDSYATGDVAGTSYVGGLVGGNANQGTVSDSYSTGNVTGNEEVGGLVGYNIGTVSNSFWDIQTSGQATSDGGTGKNTAEMQDIATFSAWDISAVALNETNPTYIWNIVNGVTYPFLSWQS